MELGICNMSEKNPEVVFPDTEEVIFFYNGNKNTKIPKFFVITPIIPHTSIPPIIKDIIGENGSFTDVVNGKSFKYILNLNKFPFNKPKSQFLAKVVDISNKTIVEYSFQVISIPMLLDMTRYSLTIKSSVDEVIPTFYLEDMLDIDKISLLLPFSIQSRKFKLIIEIWTPFEKKKYFDKI